MRAEELRAAVALRMPDVPVDLEGFAPRESGWPRAVLRVKAAPAGEPGEMTLTLWAVGLEACRRGTERLLACLPEGCLLRPGNGVVALHWREGHLRRDPRDAALCGAELTGEVTCYD